MFAPQIHIIFNTNEEERITTPLLENPPNKIYYFTAFIKATKQPDQHMEFFQKNTSLLEEKLPHLEIIHYRVDYTNYIEVLQEISKIVKQERELHPRCNIYIHIGSGSKITAIASIEASKLWDLEYYYVYSEQYDPSGKGTRHKGKMFIEKPITFPIHKPNKKYIRILKLIEELIEKRKESKDAEIGKPFIYYKSLIEELFNRKYLYLKKRNKDYEKLKSAKYSTAQVPLEYLQNSLGYILISKNKKNKRVYLTVDGQMVLKIFQYLE